MSDDVIQVPAAFAPLFRPKRVKVFFGGRGSGKSESIARAGLIKAESEHGFSVMCARMVQKSIKDSVKGMLDSFVAQYGFPFTCLKNEIQTNLEGKFSFQGLKNVDDTSLKAMFGYSWLWVEEAEDVPDSVWDILIPTFRKEGSEIVVSFNPNDEMDATYQRFVAPYIDVINRDGFYEDDYIYVARVNYDLNPFFPETLRIESDRLKLTDPVKWGHVYNGEPRGDGADVMIKPEWFDAAVDAHEKLKLTPRGEKVTALDVADEGDDAKARCNRTGMYIADVKSWKDGDITMCAQIGVEDALAHGSSQLIYDNVGNGAAVKTYGTMGGQPKGLQFVGFGAGDGPDYPDDFYDNASGNKSAENNDRTNRDMFRNKRAQYWWLVATRFYRTYKAVVDGEYHDPDTLISINGSMAELKQVRYELTKVRRKRVAGSKLIQVESKKEMKARGLPSPNLADAVIMSEASIETSDYVFERRAPVRRR